MECNPGDREMKMQRSKWVGSTRVWSILTQSDGWKGNGGDTRKYRHFGERASELHYKWWRARTNRVRPVPISCLLCCFSCVPSLLRRRPQCTAASAPIRHQPHSARGTPAG
ncbi:hypothetical protein VTO73DRAFT_965 [Trametes versicolor]